MPIVATADTIWRIPVYLPYLQPKLTDEAVAEAERKIGYKLPAEYLALLRKQNGGYIRFSLPDVLHESIAGIGPYFPSLTSFNLGESQKYVTFPLKGLVPFDGDGHWHLCLDYREDPSNPSVTYVDIETDHQSPIADSFAGYLARLEIDVGGDYVLETVIDIEAVKAQLASALGIKFEPPDSWAHGYPVHRARLGTSSKPEWIWISPNTVRRGFVRPDNPRFHELQDLMPGYAMRFPGLPERSYVLSATEGARSKVIEACLNSRLSPRTLRAYLEGR